MADRIEVSWDKSGMSLMQLTKSLNLMSKNIRDATDKELSRAGSEVLEGAKRHVPVEHGYLRDSLKKRMRRYGYEMVVRVFADYPKSGRFRKTTTEKQKAGSPEYYAFAVEYGTKHSDAQPFLKPAAREVESKLPGRIERIVNREVDKV